MAMRVYKERKIAPIVVVGANHKSLDVAGRERLAALGCSAQAVSELAVKSQVSDLAILSTCNRFECIAFDWQLGANLKSYLLQQSLGLVKERDLYLYQGDLALEHFFKVAASLDSMVLGESQILGQVKGAYNTAIEAKTSGKLLHKLFQYAFRVAKRVRSETSVAERGVSVSYVAVQLAKQIFDNLFYPCLNFFHPIHRLPLKFFIILNAF